MVKYLQKLLSCDKSTTVLLQSTDEYIFKMKLSTGIIVIVLLFAFMEVTNGTSYQSYDRHNLGYGCHKGYCWAYCGSSWVSSFLFIYFIHSFNHHISKPAIFQSKQGLGYMGPGKLLKVRGAKILKSGKNNITNHGWATKKISHF